MTIKEQLIALKASLDTWAQNEGGQVAIAIDHAHMWEFGSRDQSSPTVILCYDGEDVRGEFAVADVTQRVDRRFTALVSRGRGYDETVGDSLSGIDGGPSGNSRPFYDLVEEAREKIRYCPLDDPNIEEPVYFHGIERAPYDPNGLSIYGYLINFSIATQLSDLQALVNRPWITTPDPINTPAPVLFSSVIPSPPTIIADDIVITS